MNSIAIRLITSTLLFMITLVFGTVPVYLYEKWMRRNSHQSTRKKVNTGGHDLILSSNFYIQVVTQIGGGILFFTVLVHMIPEVRHQFEEYLKLNHSVFKDKNEEKSHHSIEELPYVEIAICFGFFVIYLIEIIIHSLVDRKNGCTHCMSKVQLDDTNGALHCNQLLLADIHMDTTVEHRSKYNDKNGDGHFEETTTIIDGQMDRQNQVHSHTCQRDVFVMIDHSCDNNNNINKNIVEKDRLLVRFLRGFVIISSFSIHSIFDGISIGVRADSPELWTVFIAIASHKLIIALIISVELYEKCHNFLLVVFNMTLFSIKSPIGIFLVLLVKHPVDDELNPILILLNAISSGTILYIVFFEILQKDRVYKLSPFTQFLAMFVGFVLMFIINITFHIDHDHIEHT